MSTRMSKVGVLHGRDGDEGCDGDAVCCVRAMGAALLACV